MCFSLNMIFADKILGESVYKLKKHKAVAVPGDKPWREAAPGAGSLHIRVRSTQAKA
jgi:hypothetical protein